MKLFTCFALFAAAAADLIGYRRTIELLRHRAAVKNNRTGEYECVDAKLSGKAEPGDTHVHVYDEGDEYVGKFKVANNDFQIYTDQVDMAKRRDACKAAVGQIHTLAQTADDSGRRQVDCMMGWWYDPEWCGDFCSRMLLRELLREQNE